jgi:biotin carboxylase
MEKFLEKPEKDTVCFINEIKPAQIGWVEKGIAEVEEVLGKKLKILIITHKNDKKARSNAIPQGAEQIIVDLDSMTEIEKALLPYSPRLLCILCRGERNIPYFRNLIPHVPYLRTPSELSLDWATDKINMRRRLRTYNKSISPSYCLAYDYDEKTIEKIEKTVGYPCIVKPSGLAASVLVQMCSHREDLIKALKNGVKLLGAVHKKNGYQKTKPVILVEQFMEGSIFSVDVYVNSRGTIYATPLVFVQTGFSAGQTDFFGYKQMTPTTLGNQKEQKAIDVAKQSVEAMGLRSTVVHIELVRSPKGWKIVEMGPRVGGFRDFLYFNSFGINHAANDILIRLPMTPKIPRRVKAYSAVMKIYPSKEGVISSISGTIKIQSYASFRDVVFRHKKGDRVRFARNGGLSIADIYLSHTDRSQLLADMRRIEQNFIIKTDKLQRKQINNVIDQEVQEVLETSPLHIEKS